MKTASTAMKSHLQGDCTTTARLFKITRKDGTVFTFTDHDRDLSTKGLESTFSDADPSTGGWVYEAAVGLFQPSAMEDKSDLSPDNQEITAVIDSIQIKENELRYGVWDSADVEIRLVNWADLTQGEIKLRKGILGQLQMKNSMLTADVLGLNNALSILQGRSFDPACDAELGDSRCTVVVPTENGTVNTNPSIGVNDSHHLTPYSGLNGQVGGPTQIILTGTFSVLNPYGNDATEQSGFGQYTGGTVAITDVSQVGTTSTYSFTLLTGTAPSNGLAILLTGFNDAGNNTPAPTDPYYPFVVASLTATSYAVQAGYYQDGLVTFTSGVNSGLSFQVKYWDGVTLTLQNALFAAPSDGDAFVITPGCDHTISTCVSKFNNLLNFRGFPAMPGQDAILLYPNATS